MQVWLSEQARRNAESRDGWSRFKVHREHVTSLILNAASQHGKLLVLGAGNCNDLDLSRLTERFAEVHLVDIDKSALDWGVAKQTIANPDHITVHAGNDLSGVADVCARWSQQSPPYDEELSATIERSRTVRPLAGLPEFDVVASVCVLSQLIEIVSRALGDSHPRFLEFVSAIRLRHLGLLFELLRERGTGILITDFVSTMTSPELTAVADSDLPWLVNRLIGERNFFSGLNPVILESILRQSPEFSTRLTAIQLSRPWKWDLGPRVYACCALSASLVPPQ